MPAVDCVKLILSSIVTTLSIFLEVIPYFWIIIFRIHTVQIANPVFYDDEYWKLEAVICSATVVTTIMVGDYCSWDELHYRISAIASHHIGCSLLQYWYSCQCVNDICSTVLQ